MHNTQPEPVSFPNPSIYNLLEAYLALNTHDDEGDKGLYSCVSVCVCGGLPTIHPHNVLLGDPCFPMLTLILNLSVWCKTEVTPAVNLLAFSFLSPLYGHEQHEFSAVFKKHAHWVGWISHVRCIQLGLYKGEVVVHGDPCNKVVFRTEVKKLKQICP